MKPRLFKIKCCDHFISDNLELKIRTVSVMGQIKVSNLLYLLWCLTNDHVYFMARLKDYLIQLILYTILLSLDRFYCIIVLFTPVICGPLWGYLFFIWSQYHRSFFCRFNVNLVFFPLSCMVSIFRRQLLEAWLIFERERWGEGCVKGRADM